MTIETFGPEHRPIVEFAVDNVQTLKLRKAKLHKQATHDDKNVKENRETNKSDAHSHKKDRKRKSRDLENSGKDSVTNAEDEVGRSVPNGKGHKSKRHKGDHTSGKAEGLPHKDNSEGLPRKPKNNDQDGKNHGGKTVVQGQTNAINANKTQYGKKADIGLKKRKMQNQTEQDGEKFSKKRSKKNKEPVGKDVVDKLDMLIQQYRSKFSQQNSHGNDSEKKPSKQIRKWFES
ncbi:hypothetical protein L6164_035527 [Bauhinia variegata]|uniref:Uncharacterized protein n=1 Tax=Bauhinia variegata TaxID=167791 RepID=A0ACB9KE84_BAUVA|nr:hypothetical protein L6164_035527 [Bauhinia variegata]